MTGERDEIAAERLGPAADVDDRPRRELGEQLERARRQPLARWVHDDDVGRGLEDVANRINGITLQFERMVGEDEKLFGSVTNRDIADQLKKAGIEIDHRWVQLDNPVKALGKYETTVRLAAGVIAQMKFWVVSKDK